MVMDRNSVKAIRERSVVWWQTRSRREHAILAGWGGAVVILLLWFAVISPLSKRIGQLEKRIPELESRLYSMRAQPRNEARAQATGTTQSAADLRSTLFRLLADKKISCELRGVSATRVELRLPELSMPDALALLEFLRQESGARVVTLNVKADSPPATVSRIVVELERAP
jgi:type II secretory pathway component PulM